MLVVGKRQVELVRMMVSDAATDVTGDLHGVQDVLYVQMSTDRFNGCGGRSQVAVKSRLRMSATIS